MSATTSQRVSFELALRALREGTGGERGREILNSKFENRRIWRRGALLRVVMARFRWLSREAAREAMRIVYSKAINGGASDGVLPLRTIWSGFHSNDRPFCRRGWKRGTSRPSRDKPSDGITFE